MKRKYSRRRYSKRRRIYKKSKRRTIRRKRKLTRKRRKTKQMGGRKNRPWWQKAARAAGVAGAAGATVMVAPVTAPVAGPVAVGAGLYGVGAGARSAYERWGQSGADSLAAASLEGEDEPMLPTKVPLASPPLPPAPRTKKAPRRQRRQPLADRKKDPLTYELHVGDIVEFLERRVKGGKFFVDTSGTSCREDSECVVSKGGTGRIAEVREDSWIIQAVRGDWLEEMVEVNRRDRARLKFVSEGAGKMEWRASSPLPPPPGLAKETVSHG